MEKENTHIDRLKASNRDLFRLPDGYFDQLPQKVMDRVETPVQPVHHSGAIRFLKPIIGIAASIALVIGLVYFPMQKFSQNGGSSNETITTMNEESYLISSIDDHNIFELLEDDAPEETFDNQQLENVLISSVDEYELIVLN